MCHLEEMKLYFYLLLFKAVKVKWKLGFFRSNLGFEVKWDCKLIIQLLLLLLLSLAGKTKKESSWLILHYFNKQLIPCFNLQQCASRSSV